MLQPPDATPASADRPAPRKKPLAHGAPFLSRLEAGGSLAEGLDATDSATRAGGIYLGASHRIARDFVLGGRYSASSGHVVARLPGNANGHFGVPNDVDVLETRHAVGVAFGYVARLEGPLEVFGMPFLGPRVAFLLNDVAPRWAFEAEFGARVGLWAGESFEASALLAYAPALAKERDVPDVHGAMLSELRFGASATARATDRLGLTMGYEGNVVTLEHQTITSHAVALGFTFSLE